MVENGRIIGVGYNRRVQDGNPTAQKWIAFVRLGDDQPMTMSYGTRPSVRA